MSASNTTTPTLATGPTTGSATTPPPTSEPTTSPSSTAPPPTTTENTTTPTSPPPSSNPPSQTSQPPSQTSGNGDPSNASNPSPPPSNTNSNTNASTTPTSSRETTVSTPVTTVVQTTVVTTDGQGIPVTTVYETSTTVPAGGVITAPVASNTASVDSNTGASTSSSNAGAIVGGVVGGVAGVAILTLILVWGYKRWKRRRDLEAFDGNFDPDRVVASDTDAIRPASTLFGNSKNQDAIGPTLPDMAQYDDGMGGRLAGAAVGGGVVSPYPLFGGPGQQYANAPPSQHGHGSDTTHSYNTHSPPPSATFGAMSSGSGHPGDWRHPSPGPSLGAATSSSSGGGVGMSPGRLAKEREAFGGGFAGAAAMPLPQHQQYGPGAGPPPSAYYNQQSPQGRRMSLESSGAHSGVFYSTNSEYSQPNSSSYAAGPGAAQRLSVANPDVDSQGHGFDESARQAYLAGGPVGSRVRVARDAGAIGEEEIPPTYDSLVSGSTSGKGDRKEKGGGLRVTNESDEGVGGSGSGAAGKNE
ncbi:hypothetical protein PQX77_013962 [Marasmius sp. AFHP31]|nr:hypothetical protein PQX77_013962 [Marasmius sp. AFHP31]